MKSGEKAEKSDKLGARGRQREKSDNPVGNRILRSLDGRTRKWLSDESRVSESTISDCIKNGIAKTDVAIAVADALKVSVGWLLLGLEAGQSDMVRDRQQEWHGPESDSPPERDDLVEVDEIDARLGAGGVVMDETAVPEKRTFSRSWLRQLTTTPPEELYWTRPKGNSMAPTIADGEPVLIDRRQNTVLDADLVWAFAWGDVGAIKRLRPMPDGTVKILSDNPSVPPDLAHEGEIHIFGRVVAVVKKV